MWDDQIKAERNAAKICFESFKYDSHDITESVVLVNTWIEQYCIFKKSSYKIFRCSLSFHKCKNIYDMS